MNEFVTFAGGHFFCQGGGLVGDNLYIECGADFEKCARLYTTADYSPYYGIREVHDEFWHNRSFRILFLKQSTSSPCWINGRVVSWNEYTMGPGDRCCKWVLNADLEPATEPAIGALVELVDNDKKKEDEENENEEPKLAVITEIRGEACVVQVHDTASADDTDTTDATITVPLKDVKLTGGRFSFKCNCMNVQGGGTVLLSTPNVSGISDRSLLSLEWQDPVETDYYFHPAKTTTTPTHPVCEEDLMRGRKNCIRITNSGELHLLEQLAIDQIDDPGALRKQLLCTPFPAIPYVLRPLFEIIEEEKEEGVEKDVDDCDLVQVIAEAVVELSKDKEWHQWVYKEAKLPFRSRARMPDLTPQERQGLIWYGSLNDAMDQVGKFYGRRGEHRAAGFWYQVLLDLVEKSSLEQMILADDFFAERYCDLGVAHRGADNLVAASRAFDKALMYKSTMDGSNVFGNARLIQDEVKLWIGTSGKITPWGMNERYTADEVCSACNKHAELKCGACKLVSYCSAKCQRKHWAKAHKLTCLGYTKKDKKIKSDNKENDSSIVENQAKKS